jgi:aminopeptidase 2
LSCTNFYQYDAVLDFYRKSNNSDERNSALRCLGRAKDPELMKRTLALLSSSEVKDQDIYMPASGLRSHPEGIEALRSELDVFWNKALDAFKLIADEGGVDAAI